MSGTKHDAGKAPLDLLPHESLVEVAKVLAFGEKKYSAGNWAKGIEYRRLISAAQRHLGEFNSGVDLDDESKLYHTAHAACCLLFLISMQLKRPDLDNRWAKDTSGSQLKPGAIIQYDASEGKPICTGAGKKTLKLEVGKRYRRRDGKVVKMFPYEPTPSCSHLTLTAASFLYDPKSGGAHGVYSHADLLEEV